MANLCDSFNLETPLFAYFVSFLDHSVLPLSISSVGDRGKGPGNVK